LPAKILCLVILQTNILLTAVFAAFCTAASVQLFYWLWFYLSPYLYKGEMNQNKAQPVSVIICARNEAENLKRFLPSVLEQKYPSFEVIVVNDCSEDSTDDVLGEFLVKYPNLRISSITKDPKFTHNKKFAQFIGIKAAINEILVFTDADCSPESENWLSLIASNFSEKRDFVLCYGGYMSGTGFLNRYIRCDSMFIAMQYLGMALKGIPYMGVGRNLAYRRSVFFANKGFGAHSHIASGDDDLFVNANAKKERTTIELREGSHTRSVPSETWSQFLKQKARHFTTAKFYKPLHRFLLIMEPLTRILFYALFIILISFLFMWEYVVAVFAIRLIVQTTVLILNQKKLHEKGLLFYSLIFDIFSPFINSLIYLKGSGSNRGINTWK
jgi:poly-beta-1,6-N-acetyl-D-glucosamine synthase